jgi:hypothetical protein
MRTAISARGWANTLGLTSPSTVPGGLTSITGDDGKQYPIQTLWSNESAGGAGYCAGCGNDFPVTG